MKMEHGTLYAVGGVLLVILCIGGAAFFLRSARLHSSTPIPVHELEATKPTNLTGLSIYTDGKYGFSIFYPATDTTHASFDKTPSLPESWRIGAVATGTPVLAIEDTPGDASISEVRIGASDAKAELAQCLRTGPGEVKLPDTHLGGTAFKTFSYDRTGTDDEVLVTSYRAVHDATCIALESFHSTSIASSTDLLGIVQSFSFARP